MAGSQAPEIILLVSANGYGLYAQLSGKKSLRDLVFSLGRHQRKLYHLGLAAVKRSTWRKCYMPLKGEGV